MPESYLWLLNNVGNVFTLGTQHLKFTQLCSEWIPSVTVKRLSSSLWCSWALGHDHRVYIYVFSSDVPVRVPDTLYENQRKIPYRGFSPSFLFPTDRFPWSDEKGIKETPKESFRLPSAHWQWEGKWMLDENLRGEVVGREGWQYAVDFPSQKLTNEEHWQTFVRKRKWIRFRRFTSVDTWVRISDMEVVEKSECFIDISVGGFCLASQAPGFLAVWAVTNNGHVYVRPHVCRDNPEGDTWQEIPLGSNLGVVNISVGASNLVWAITWDGHSLVRTGINRNNVYGTQWEVVECPDDSVRFMQVAVGRNVVWALSREGKVWFRKGTYGDDIHGNVSSLLGSMWVEMVGEMSHLAVAANDQVFAIGENGKHVFIRSGVTSSNLTGKTWQKIVLREDTSMFQPEAETGDDERENQRAASVTTSCSSGSIFSTTEDLSDVLYLTPMSPKPFPDMEQEMQTVEVDSASDLKSKSDTGIGSQEPQNFHGKQPGNKEEGQGIEISVQSEVNANVKGESVKNDSDALSWQAQNGNSGTGVSGSDQSSVEVKDPQSSLSSPNVTELCPDDHILSKTCETNLLSDPLISNTDLNAQNHDIKKSPPSIVILRDSSCELDITVTSTADAEDKLDATTHRKKTKHKKSNLKHARPDTLALEDDVNSIVYKSQKEKKKKKKARRVSERHQEEEVDNERKMETNGNVTEDKVLCGANPTVLGLEALHDMHSLVALPSNTNGESIHDSGDQHSATHPVQEYAEMTGELIPIERVSDGVTSGLQEINNSSERIVVSLKIDVTEESEDKNRPDSLTAEIRRLSLDSPVSDGIIDFVSYFDSDGEEESKQERMVDETDRQQTDPVITKSYFSSANENAGPLKSNVGRQFSLCSELSSPDGKIPQDSFDTERSSLSSFQDQSQEIIQLLPLAPSRKVFRYRQSPSPNVMQAYNGTPTDPATFDQDRYMWRWLDVSALYIDDIYAVKWLKAKDKITSEGETTFKISDSLRKNILKKLKMRNWTEVHQYINYEQAVKKTAWVKKATMQLFTQSRGGQWLPCNVELEQSKTDSTNQTLSLIYAEKKNQKVKKVKRLALSALVCVKNCKERKNAFDIYTSTDIRNPPRLLASSEIEAREWVNLLYSANSKQCNLTQPISPGAIWSCTQMGDVLASAFCPKESNPEQFLWGQHGGHLSLIESGAGGITWAIGFDRMPYVYNGGYGGAICVDDVSMSNCLQEMTDTDRIYVYENEMWYPGLGWCTKGLLSNNFNWITEDGRSVESREDIQLLSSKWHWVSGWTIDFNTPGGVDSDNGWQYCSHWTGSFHDKKHIRDTYRRRRWVRTCGLSTQGPWMSAGSLSLLDVSIQIDPVYSSTEAIVVWAVATNGNVLCRYGVSKDNPLGVSWVNVPTDLDEPFVSISIGGGWRVWGIANDGSTWFRSGVTQYMPLGRCWLQVVERPSGKGMLRHVSAGATAVWAVDSEGNLWRRRNITKTFPEGTDWELVAAKVRRVSVGPSDQVWIVSTRQFNGSNESAGGLFRRTGITSAKPSGSKWEKIIGNGWSHVCIRGIQDDMLKG